MWKLGKALEYHSIWKYMEVPLIAFEAKTRLSFPLFWEAIDAVAAIEIAGGSLFFSVLLAFSFRRFRGTCTNRLARSGDHPLFLG